MKAYADCATAYDPAFGYPTRINLDFGESVIDDELLIHASELEIFARWATFE